MKVAVFGDSHCSYFSISPQLRNVLGYNFSSLRVDLNKIKGATIKGLGRRKSSLETNKRVFDFLSSSEFGSRDYLVLAFGQVDIELGYYYSTYVKGDDLDFDLYCQDVVVSYKEFINSLPVDAKRVVVKGVNVPVLVFAKNKVINYTQRIISENIFDKEKTNAIASVMNDTFPSDYQRTNMHLVFNNMLKEMACEIGVRYFDINDELVDQKDGLIKRKYIPSGADHHLVDSLEVRRIHCCKLLRLLSQV